MLNEILYSNELDDLKRDRFEIDYNSILESKERFDRVIYSKSERLNEFIKQLRNSLKKNNYVIIRNFGIDVEYFIILNFLLSKKIYFSKRLNAAIINIKIKLNSTDLSESLYNNTFHTDFLFQNVTPDFISLQCTKRDPKYPLYGRNYLVDVNELYWELIKKFSLSEEYLLNLRFPYTFGSKTFWIHVFSKKKEKISARLHLSIIDLKKLQQDKHYFQKISIVELINQLALNLSKDFVLDEGDVVIFSNRYVLHKRGEVSLDFKSLDHYNSREINSMRFFI